MILTKNVEVQLRNKCISHYEKLGYKIPKVKDVNGDYRVKRRTIIIVNVNHLTKGSNVKILCKCDNCGKERLISYSQYRDLCQKCSMIFQGGENHHLFGKHQSDETKRKLRDSLKGRTLSEGHKEKLRYYSGENHSCYGKPRPEKTKRKISNSLMGKYSGERSPTWNPIELPPRKRGGFPAQRPLPTHDNASLKARSL